MKRMIAGAGVCPFTIDENKAGIPRGNIHYAISHASSIEQALADYWDQVCLFLTTENAEISTTLLIYSQLELFQDIKTFEKFCNCIDRSILPTNIDLEELIQLVYFHPEYRFVDKDEQVYVVFDDNGEALGLSSDFVAPVSYARRSPWPMINILRTPQVVSLQKGIPQGKVFSKNFEMLGKIGSPKLQTMLDSQNWDELPINAPYLKTVISNQFTDKILKAKADARLAVEENDEGDEDVRETVVRAEEEEKKKASSLLESFQEKQESGALDQMDYLNLADEVEKWLQESAGPAQEE